MFARRIWRYQLHNPDGNSSKKRIDRVPVAHEQHKGRNRDHSEKCGWKIGSAGSYPPYPENYKAIVDQVVVENAAGFWPPLKTKIDSIEKYDVIILGLITKVYKTHRKARFPDDKRAI